MLYLKGTPSKEASWPQTEITCKNLHLENFVWLFYQYLCNRNTFAFAPTDFESSGRNHVGSLYADEEQTKGGS